jgi:glycosyltransferase involved in cell wall biosynthesis
MFISVVIPTHFRPTKLEKLLDSLVNQTYPKENFEVIVVPSSNDSGLEIVNQFNNSLDLVVSPIPSDPYKGKSPSLKRNHGVSVSRGEWIAFTDDDCVADSKWLENISNHISDDISGIEGLVRIPEPDAPTLTYKGIKRLSTPGGYQTCNIAYNKIDFLNADGFDLTFPFYLEDTDLGWSILEQGGKIIFADDVIIEHPVPISEPERLISGAKRTALLVYFYKKHPNYYKDYKIQTFRFSYRIYLLIYLAILISLLTLNSFGILVSTVLLLFLLSAHLIKMFWNCSFTVEEITKTALYTLAIPIISLIYLFKGIIRYRTIPPLN